MRIGNAAADQLQLDIYGEIIDSLTWPTATACRSRYEGWRSIAALPDWVCDTWDQPDEGIWETRGGQQDFTYCRLMCWVALDRAIRIAHDAPCPPTSPAGPPSATAIFDVADGRGLERREGARSSSTTTTDVLDASLLLMPLVGFISPRPRWLSTLDAIDRELVSDSLVYRYDPAASPGRPRGDEGTFSLCTFCYVEALARPAGCARPPGLREDADLRATTSASSPRRSARAASNSATSPRRSPIWP